MAASIKRAFGPIRSAKRSRPVAIVGAGTQGRRLAFMWSSLGSPVNIIDRDPLQLKAAASEVEHRRSGPDTSMDGLLANHRGGKVSTFLADDRMRALEGAWLTVECVPESLKLKRAVVEDLDEVADPSTIIASNSSSYTISEIIAGLSLKHPDRLVSLHSYWPPETPAIEIMASQQTSSEIIPLLMEECRAHGFVPFHVKKNSNGYIYNRIWAAIKREALFVAAEGVAAPAEVDEIFRTVLKTPKGPFEQMDVVGLDVVLDIEEHYAETRSGLPTEPRELLKKMIREGSLGIKSGRGFYTYKRD